MPKDVESKIQMVYVLLWNLAVGFSFQGGWMAERIGNKALEVGLDVMMYK